MKIVNYNIQFSRGNDDRYDLQRIADTIRTADIISLQEVERYWPRSGMEDQPAKLSELFPEHYWVYAPVFDVHDGGAPAENRRRQFGNMLLSTYPIRSSRTVVLPKKYYPDKFNMYQGALEGVLVTPCGNVSVWNIHLGYLDSDERLSQLSYLMDMVKRMPVEHGAWSGPGDLQGNDWSCGSTPPPGVDHVILSGDFNSEPDSSEYKFTIGNGFKDAATIHGDRTKGFTHTREYTNPPLSRRIDYCFLSEGLAGQVSRYWVDELAIGSDHQPVWVEFLG